VPGSEVPAFSAAEMHLELWMDKGLLTGRYRAWLPDFDGVKRVDLSLSGKAGSGHTQTLTFHSANPEAEGPLGRSVRPVLTMAAERFSSTWVSRYRQHSIQNETVKSVAGQPYYILPCLDQCHCGARNPRVRRPADPYCPVMQR